jgi:hypothetical protein
VSAEPLDEQGLLPEPIGEFVRYLGVSRKFGNTGLSSKGVSMTILPGAVVPW